MEGVIASTIKAQHVSNEMQFRISTRVRLHSFLFEHELCFFPSCNSHTEGWFLFIRTLEAHLLIVAFTITTRLIAAKIPSLKTFDFCFVLSCTGTTTDSAQNSHTSNT